MILANADRNVIANSEWSSSAVYGMKVDNGSDFNLIASNVAERNQAQATLLLDASNNVLTGNRFSLSAAGIQIADASHGNWLVGNSLSENRTGIFSGFGSPTGTVLLGNRANDNGDLGISAAVGARDGGLNRAAGNGDPRQCVNVVCRP